MASVHKVRGKPNWRCAFTVYDNNGKAVRRFRSTGTADKRQAQQVCNAWQRAALKARNGKLTADTAREVIAAGVADVLLATTGAEMQRHSVRSWCETWLEAKKVEAEESTRARYAPIIEHFLEFLGAEADRDIAILHVSHVKRFRDREAELRSKATANLSLKVLRICLGEGVKQEVLTVNPAARVDVLKVTKKSRRRAFTQTELKRILAACGDDVEWRGLVLFGYYFGGQRLGDLSRLTWRGVNFETREFMVREPTEKSDRYLSQPLVQPLVDYLSALPASDNPDACIFPRAAKAKRTSTLSNQFREILVRAGLAQPRTHQSTGKGRSSPRRTSELSFHCFRHTATSALKSAGVSDSVAMAIVGHDTPAISRTYTHIPMQVLREALERLPDITHR